MESKEKNTETWCRFTASPNENRLLRNVQISMELKSGIKLRKEDVVKTLALEGARKRVETGNFEIKLLENENS